MIYGRISTKFGSTESVFSRVNLGRINFGRGSFGLSILKQFCGLLTRVALFAAPEGGL
jgi:hypothetical protein